MRRVFRVLRLLRAMKGGLYTCWYVVKLRLSQPALCMARYMLVQMGSFSVSARLMYNDMFSVDLPVFDSAQDAGEFPDLVLYLSIHFLPGRHTHTDHLRACRSLVLVMMASSDGCRKCIYLRILQREQGHSPHSHLHQHEQVARADHLVTDGFAR